MDIIPCYIAGRPETGDDPLIVHSPADGREVGRTAYATEDQVERAVAAAVAAADRAAATAAHVRAGALDHVSRRLTERADEVARLITAESGKPIKWARGEVSRAISTFRWAAEEARRFSGEVQRLDTDPAATGRLAYVRRVPKGPILGISPFNFPLNLVAHKIAPAIAVGAPIIVKPAPATPLSALLLGEILAEVTEHPDGTGGGLPAGMFSILPIPNERATALVADPRLPVVSFTGSGPVGARIRSAVPAKHVTLELGGNAAAVVCGDWSSAVDLEWAAGRIAVFANYQAGQSCIAVQRVIVHTDVYDAFVPLLVDRVRALPLGDPDDESVEVGPVINVAAADRIEAWVREAEASGARNLTGWYRYGNRIDPIVLEGAPADARVCADEVFGPVLVLSRVDSDADAFAAVNDSAFGLQAGVFTHNLRTAFTAHRTLAVGGVIIGDVPSYRADQMPYGGVKGSGVGREGLRSAMDDYTDVRVMVLTGLDL